MGKKGHFVLLDVPGQTILSRYFCCFSCPGTKGQHDKETFFVPGQRDSGTRKLFCPGTKGQRNVPSLGNPTLIPCGPSMSGNLQKPAREVSGKQTISLVIPALIFGQIYQRYGITSDFVFLLGTCRKPAGHLHSRFLEVSGHSSLTDHTVCSTLKF